MAPESAGIFEALVAFGAKWLFYIAGALGAAIGAGFNKGAEPLQKIFQFVGGVFMAWAIGSPIADAIHFAPEIIGFIVGGFGMAIFGKLYGAIDGVPFVNYLNQLFKGWVRKMGGAEEEK